MGSFGFAALTVLLLAFALLPDPAAARVLQGKKPGSSEGAPAPTVATGGSKKSPVSKELGQSATPVQNPETDKQHQKTPPPETTQTPPPPETTETPKDSPPPPSGVPESKGQEGGEAQVSAQPVPSNGRNQSPPPGSPKSTGGTDRQGGGSSGNKKPATESKEVAEKCKDPVDRCSIEGELSACLQVSKTASSGQFFIVHNTGQNTITVDVKATSDISMKQKLLPLSKGESKRVSISYNSPNGGEITLNVGTEHCVLRIRQPVYDWQQQFQQLTAYATTVKPIYGALVFSRLSWLGPCLLAASLQGQSAMVGSRISSLRWDLRLLTHQVQTTLQAQEMAGKMAGMTTGMTMKHLQNLQKKDLLEASRQMAFL